MGQIAFHAERASAAAYSSARPLITPKIIYAPTARRQLADIGGNERFTESARRAMIARIISACEGCAAYPLRYPKGDREGFRRRRVAPFIIDYRITETGVEIAHVWHERQSREIRPRE